MAESSLVQVRNRTGESRWVGDLGEDGYVIRRTVADDEILELPAELAERLTEQPGWELDGDLPEKAPRNLTTTITLPASGDASDDDGGR